MNRILERLAQSQPVILDKVAVRFNQTRDGAGILIGELRVDRLYGIGGIYEVRGHDVVGPEPILDRILFPVQPGSAPEPKNLYLYEHGVVLRRCYLAAANTIAQAGGMRIATYLFWQCQTVEEFTPPEDDLPMPLIVPAN